MIKHRVGLGIVAIFALWLVPQIACNFGVPAPHQEAEEPFSIPQGTQDSSFLVTPAGEEPATSLSPTERLMPADLQYLGAFRLPGGEERPKSFAYGGSAMTYNPSGDPGGTSDGFPGSLFISGHDRMPYGEVPDGSQIAEINIPVPIAERSLESLNQADFLQDFHDVAKGAFQGLDEIPRIGMQYLDTAITGPKIHIAWGQHLQEDQPSHGWFNPDLSNPEFRGEWFIGNQSPFSVNGYMLEIPKAWADAHVSGRYLGTGRYKDGGWSGMGPALFAYRPWSDDNDSGTPPPFGTHLEETVLLLYEKPENTDKIERCLQGYQHTDEWEGAAWVTTASGKSAVLFVGNKSVGNKYWYGYVNPAGAEYPCVDGDMVNEFTVCWQADGTSCPPQDLIECPGHNDYRGWWTSQWQAEFIFYDPTDLARVVSGEIQPWEPQPYASLVIDEHLFLNPAKVEADMLGSGTQRRYRVSEMAYDRTNGLLYVLELYADSTKPIVHAWRIHP